MKLASLALLLLLSPLAFAHDGDGPHDRDTVAACIKSKGVPITRGGGYSGCEYPQNQAENTGVLYVPKDCAKTTDKDGAVGLVCNLPSSVVAKPHSAGPGPDNYAGVVPDVPVTTDSQGINTDGRGIPEDEMAHPVPLGRSQI